MSKIDAPETVSMDVLAEVAGGVAEGINPGGDISAWSELCSNAFGDAAEKLQAARFRSPTARFRAEQKLVKADVRGQYCNHVRGRPVPPGYWGNGGPPGSLH